MSNFPRIKQRLFITRPLIDIPNDYHISCVIVDTSLVENQGFSKDRIHFYQCMFDQQTIQQINFKYCEFFECQFVGVRINFCEFHNCTFDCCNFYKARIEGSYLDPSSFVFKPLWRKKHANINTAWFQALYCNAKNTRQETHAMRADMRFQSYYRAELIFGKNPNYFRYINRLGYCVFMGNGYGRSNVLAVSILLILIFTLFMQCWTSAGVNASFFDVLYFSVVTFSTVGYGDIAPSTVHLFPICVTMLFLAASVIWLSITTAVIIKRIVK